MPDYIVLQSEDLDDLRTKVCEYLGGGYVPCGGVYVVTASWENERKGYTETSTTYYQAVWRS